VTQKNIEEDMLIFTSTVLLVSSVSAIARDELDMLIEERTNQDQNVDELRRARSGVAALAAIAEYYQGDRQ